MEQNHTETLGKITKEKFRCKLSEYAHQNGIGRLSNPDRCGWAWRGWPGQKSDLVNVLWDGTRTKYSYHNDFIQRLPKSEIPEEKQIPVIDGGFKPSMADISLMLDFLSEEGEPDKAELRRRAEEYLFGLVDIYNTALNWKEFKKNKLNKEKLEIKTELKENGKTGKRILECALNPIETPKSLL